MIGHVIARSENVEVRGSGGVYPRHAVVVGILVMGEQDACGGVGEDIRLFGRNVDVECSEIGSDPVPDFGDSVHFTLGKIGNRFWIIV